jgi:hypothetical protein
VQYPHFTYPALLSTREKQNLLNEARLCIADCEESKLDGGQEFQEEAAQASEVVEEAFAAYLDMLEEFQGCDGEVRKRLGGVREESTAHLKALRKELDQILKKAV